MLDVCSLAFSSAVTGAVDGAGGAMGTDANGGGTRSKLVALAYTIIDWHILEVGTIRAVVVYVELGCAGRDGGHSERQKDEGQGGEAAHAGDHGYKLWKVVVRHTASDVTITHTSHRWVQKNCFCELKSKQAV